MYTCGKCGFKGEGFYSKNICQECNKKYMREHYEKNKDKRKEYYKKNKERILSNIKEWNLTESGKISCCIKNSKRRLLTKNTSDGTITKQSLKQLIKLQNNKCHICTKELNFKDKNQVHLDHHIPLSKGGKHSIENVVYLCRDCNLHKSATIPKTLLLV